MGLLEGWRNRQVYRAIIKLFIENCNSEQYISCTIIPFAKKLWITINIVSGANHNSRNKGHACINTINGKNFRSRLI